MKKLSCQLNLRDPLKINEGGFKIVKLPFFFF